MPGKVERVFTWREFKELLIRLRPPGIYYAQGNAPLSTPPIELRLVFVAEGVQYVFVDTAKGDVLRRTGVPISVDQYGNYSFQEDDIKNFIYTQSGRSDIKIGSFELMGGY